MEFGDLSDNPFSAHSAPQRSKRRSIASAFKFLILVAVCLAVTLIIGSQSQRWLVHELTRDFESLSADEKRDRLTQMAKLGRSGIDPLVQSIADEDVEVAHWAYEVLRQTQNEWMVLKRDEQQVRHETLIESLKSIAVQLPDDRTGWGTNLLQQTLMTTIERRDDDSRQLYAEASKAIDLLSLSDRAGPSILSDEPLDPKAPRRLVVQSEPLPVAAAEPMDEWTDWPPPKASATKTAASMVIASEPELVEKTDSQQVIQSVSPNQPSQGVTQSPSGSVESSGSSAGNVELYRSPSARLQPVGEDEPVILRDVSQQRPAKSPVGESPVAKSPVAKSPVAKSPVAKSPVAKSPVAKSPVAKSPIGESSSGAVRAVTYLVDSPMETFDDKSVVHWLASPHASLRDKAKLELIARGFNGTQLAIATELATGDVATRIELIDSISRSSAVDPRPWLMMMLDDESRDVKLRVISILATMKDPDVNQRLRMHLVDERDPTVAARIRRVLNLR